MLSQELKQAVREHITSKRKLYDSLKMCNKTIDKLAQGQVDFSKQLTLSVIVSLARLAKAEIQLAKLLQKQGEGEKKND